MDEIIRKADSPFTSKTLPVSIIMAAGHGKRIKSRRPKMLHDIWGVPTVVRVCRAAAEGLSSPDQIVVVGKNAGGVIERVGKAPGRRFALQNEQKGTGHAVQAALSNMAGGGPDRDIYVFPGDKGLLDGPTIRAFMENFNQSRAAMMVMVSTFSGSIEDNSHGRIVRVPEKDARGNPSPPQARGNIIKIVEQKDILAMPAGALCRITYQGREYAFTREALLNSREFNGGVYAFRGKALKSHIGKLSADNAQKEIYLTDLITLFSQNNLPVGAAPASSEEAVLGFNDKTILHRMESVARKKVFQQLRNIVTLQNKDDFFIADEVVAQIIDMDKKGLPPDIFIGEGSHLGAGVVLSPGVRIEKGARLTGNIVLGQGVFVGEAALLTTFADQKMAIGDNSQILQRNILKGNLTVGKNCLIETTVRLTGSNAAPAVIGNNVRIKGTTYMYGCKVEDNVFVQNCYLFEKKIRFKKDGDGNPVKVCHIKPEPQGKACVENRV
jgi:bifunctional UDP-N-acetylglucosamine pyrophosphorylase/glucosamine-1-phosphate N-acetyltransferase